MRENSFAELPLEAAMMEKLRQLSAIVAAPELDGTIHHFAALSRLITKVGRAAFFWISLMDSQSRVFESTLASAQGTPLPCHRPMVPQSIVAWTPGGLVAAAFAALISAPLQLAPAVINRRRA